MKIVLKLPGEGELTTEKETRPIPWDDVGLVLLMAGFFAVIAAKGRGRTAPGHKKHMYCIKCRDITEHIQIE